MTFLLFHPIDSLKTKIYATRSRETFHSFRFYEMFSKMLAVHCDQNDSYEITINGFQVRKINEIIHQVLNLVNIPTLALTLRKVFHSGDCKFRFLFRFLF